MTQPRRALVTLDRVKKDYRTRDGVVQALEEIDLDIHEGEFLSVVGPSGCGKSTLLMLISGLVAPSGGAIPRCRCGSKIW